MVFNKFKNNSLCLKSTRFFIILFMLIFLTTTVKTKSAYQLEEMEANKDKEITLESTELYVATKINETGYLGHRLIVPTSIGSLKNCIYFASLNSTEIINDSEFVEVDSMTDYNDLTQDIGPFEVEKNKYAILKFVGLKKGEKMTVKAYYISKGLTIGFIIIIIVIALLVIIGVAFIIKKCCFKKKKVIQTQEEVVEN